MKKRRAPVGDTVYFAVAMVRGGAKKGRTRREVQLETGEPDTGNQSEPVWLVTEEWLGADFAAA